MNAPATLEDAKAELRAALREVERDNPVGATRRVVEVARRCEFPCRGTWTAFAFSAEQLVKPYFDRRKDISAATAATMALCGLFDSKRVPESDKPSSQSDVRAPSRPKAVAVAIADGAR